MYQVSKEEWNKIKNEHPDFVGKAIRKYEHDGKVCNIGDWTCFEGLMPGADKTVGAALIFEHIHFEIV